MRINPIGTSCCCAPYNNSKLRKDSSENTESIVKQNSDICFKGFDEIKKGIIIGAMTTVAPIISPFLSSSDNDDGDDGDSSNKPPEDFHTVLADDSTYFAAQMDATYG